MTRRERNRRIRRLKAQLKRAGVILALLLAVILMVCGCLYIGEHLFQKDDKVEGSKDAGKSNEENSSGENSEENPEGTPNENVPLDTDTQILNTYNYQYTKPVATGLHIVLDAGHGGIDGGTQAGDVIEKDVNLAVTQKVAALLREAGATVTMIRETDEYVDLADRSYKGNQTNANLFLSLHCNYYEGDTSIDGLEIYFHRNSETSKQLAETVTQLLKDTETIKVRDTSQQNMQVLRNSSIPAIMVEMGFLSNPEECANLSDDLYQEFLARLLTTSVVNGLKPAE